MHPEGSQSGLHHGHDHHEKPLAEGAAGQGTAGKYLCLPSGAAGRGGAAESAAAVCGQGIQGFTDCTGAESGEGRETESGGA